MKQNKKHVLFYPPTGMFFRSSVRDGVGPNNLFVVEVKMTYDLDQAELGSKNKCNQMVKRLKKYHLRDERKQPINMDDFQIREVKVSYEMLP